MGNTQQYDSDVQATNPTDRASRNLGKTRLMDKNEVLINPATESTLSSTLSREIATWSAGTLPVEQQTPVGLEDNGGVQVDPAENVDGLSAAGVAGGTGSANAAAISVPDGRTDVTAAWDISGAADITVEVSPDGGNTWYQETLLSPGSAETGTYNFTTGFDDVRVYVSANLNSAHIGAKGA